MPQIGAGMENAAHATILDVIVSHAGRVPGKGAVTSLRDGESDAEVLSYATLLERARAAAAGLQVHAARNDRVALLFPAGLEFVTAFLGSLLAGVTAVPMPLPNDEESGRRIMGILRDCGAKAAVVDSAHRERIERSVRGLGQLDGLAWIDASELSNASSFQPAEPAEYALLQYTSGSTSTPRGVMATHANLLHNSSVLQKAIDSDEDSVVVSWLPHYHDMGLVLGILQGLFVGGHVVLMSPGHFLQRPARWLEAITAHGGTHSTAPNFAYDYCAARVTPAECEKLDLRRWRTAVNGAEPVRPDTLRRFTKSFAPAGFRFETFVAGYGLAESTLVVSSSKLLGRAQSYHVSAPALAQHEVLLEEYAGDSTRELAGSGAIVEGLDVRIVDPETCVACAAGRVGEIWVRGDSVTAGYWNAAALNEETFGARIAGSGEGPFLRTGDLGCFIANDLVVTGRLKDLIIIRGANYYPQDIEAAIGGAHPALRTHQAVAFAVEEDGRELLAAAHEVKPDWAGDPEDVAAAIRVAVARAMGIEVRTVMLLESGALPKTTSGKVQRGVCREMLRDRGKGVLAVVRYAGDDGVEAMPKPATAWAHGDIVRIILELVARRMGIAADSIDLSCPFAALGLSSIATVQLMGELHERLGRPLAPTLPYEYPTIAALAAHLSAPASGGERQGARATAVEPIAIVGMSCRFPGARDLESFWKLLVNGEDAIREVPRERWDIEHVYDPNPATPGKMHTRWGGFLDNVDEFDAQFFGISPREAAAMDPQQRMLLEVAWEALENAGIAPDSLRGSATGTFVGIGPIDYTYLHLLESDASDAYMASGCTQSIAANRIAYSLDLHGPSMAIDTACSSSLVAIHQACQSLRSGECTTALAGGANAVLTPFTNVVLSQARMLSPTGRCRAFDADADGYVRGEGVGMIVLKRLNDALRDEDRIFAVIRGSAINHDGRSNGLTAPNGAAQESVMRHALAAAGVDAADVDLIEAHGTGTSLGDPIEFESINRVYGAENADSRRAYLGSVKTNIGHLETAAGVAGLMKAVLALSHEVIPPHLHVKSVNPLIPLEQSIFRLPDRPILWPRSSRPRLAAVSGFGFGGANAHVVLEESPLEGGLSAVVPRDVGIFKLAAASPSALRALAARCADAVEHYDEAAETWCRASTAGRADLPWRACGVAPIRGDDARERLTGALRRVTRSEDVPAFHVAKQPAAGSPSIAFLFTGQGSQYAGMGLPLYEREPVFRASLDYCADVLRDHLERPLLDVMFGEGADAALLDQTAYTQPALFALEYSLAMLWRSWGIQPDAVLGHSIGENVAACVAGAFSLEDGLRLIARRGALIQSLSAPGSMAAIFAPLAEIEEVASAHAELSVATINGEELIVLSGAAGAMAEAAEIFHARGTRVIALRTSHAFHSPLMDPILDEFRAFAETIEFRPLRLPLISNDGGRVFEQGAIMDASYWAHHIRKPVAFSACVRVLHGRAANACVEIGPSSTLLGLARRCVDAPHALWLPSLSDGAGSAHVALNSLARLYVQGVRVAWTPVQPRAHAPLPTYPFERKRFWVTRQTPGAPSLAESILGMTPAAAAATSAHVDPALFFETIWEPAPPAVKSSADPGVWVLWGGSSRVAAALRAALEARGAVCYTAAQGATLRCLNHVWEVPHEDNAAVAEVFDAFGELKEGRVRGIIDARALEDLSPSDPAESSIRLMRLVQHVAQRSEFRDCRIHVVTHNVVPAHEAAIDLAQAPAWGFGRAVALEHPQHFGKLIDIAAVTDQALARVVDEILSDDPSPAVALGTDERRVARLDVYRAQTGARPTAFRSDATYLITGGFGGLGVNVAEWLIASGARRLLLLGRHTPPPREQWYSVAADSPNGERIAAVKRLEGLGAAIQWSSVDMSDADAVRDVVDTFEREQWPEIRGVFHLAGALHDQSIQNMTAESFNTVFGAKVCGAWALHQCFENCDLDHFVLFSSAASMLGAAGQANYAAANAYLDALAHYRRSRGQCAISINWGPWADVGMAARTHGAPSGATGMFPLDPAEAVAALGAALAANPVQVGVFRADWNRLAQRFSSNAMTAFLSRVATVVDRREANGAVADVLARVGPDREAFMLEYVQSEIARVLGTARETINLDADVIALGMDSIMVMDLLRVFQRDLTLRLYAREVFDQPNLRALASFMCGELDRMNPELAPAPAEGGFVQELVASTKALVLHRPVHLERKNPPCVFVLSSPRSGSTLFRVMLAGNRALFSPPEMHLLHFHDMHERTKVITEDFSLGDGLQRAFMELRGIDAETADALVEKFIAGRTPVHEVYAMLQEEARPRILIDKSPTYAGNLDTLRNAEAIFDGARYVYLIRHPYAVIESYVRNRTGRMFNFGSVDPFALAEDVWTEHNTVTMTFLRDVDQDRQFQVRYEELVVQPERTMREVSEFLGVPFDAGMLEPYAQEGRMTDGIRPESRAIGDPNFMTHTDIDPELGEKWRRVRLPRPLNARARETAAALGYELPREAQDGVLPLSVAPMHGFQDERV